MKKEFKEPKINIVDVLEEEILTASGYDPEGILDKDGDDIY